MKSSFLVCNLIEEHGEEWRLKGFRDFHERIVAVMFHLAVPWDVTGERLIHLSTVNFVQAGKNAGGGRLLEHSMPRLFAPTSGEVVTAAAQLTHPAGLVEGHTAVAIAPACASRI